jgi:hypothetical protein
MVPKEDTSILIEVALAFQEYEENPFLCFSLFLLLGPICGHPYRMCSAQQGKYSSRFLAEGKKGSEEDWKVLGRGQKGGITGK